MVEYIVELKSAVAKMGAEINHLSSMVEAQAKMLTASNDKIDRITAVIERHRAIVGMFGVIAGAVGTGIAHLVSKMEIFK